MLERMLERMLSQPEAAFHRRILAYDPMTATQKNTWDTWFNAILKLERLAEEQRAGTVYRLYQLLPRRPERTPTPGQPRNHARGQAEPGRSSQHVNPARICRK